ncbi:MAG: sugar transferase, partial [Muribaculaceae bacterium]|nr:sugar transferase [Muribaculaceae bacterium]
MTSTERYPSRGRFVPALFILGDIIIVNLVFWLTITIFPKIQADPRHLRELWLLLEVSCIPLAIVGWGNAHENRIIRMEREMRTALLQVCVFALTFLGLLGFIRLVAMTGRQYVTLFALMAVGLLLFTVTGKYILKKYRRKGFNFTRVVIVGTGPTAQRLRENILMDPGFGYRILGFFDDKPSPSFSGEPVYPISDLRHFVSENEVQQIFYTNSGQDDAMSEVVKVADDNVATFYYVPQLPTTMLRGFQLYSVGSLPVMSIRRNPLQRRANRVVKRAFDIIVSSTFLIFYPLIYIPVAIGIRLSSPGPIYFRQQRTGYLGRSFECLKFRTMRVNAGSDVRQATADDPRKTR